MPEKQEPRASSDTHFRKLNPDEVVQGIYDLVARGERRKAANLFKSFLPQSEPETVEERVVTSRGRVTSASPGREHDGIERSSPSPPKWWPEHSQLEFDRCEDLQRRAWALLGLTAPLQPEEVPQFIENVIAGEREEGWVRHFKYEDVAEGFTHTVLAYSGWRDDNWWDRKRAEGLSEEEAERWFELEHAARDQRLYRLCDLSGEVRGRTGCRQGEAVTFLLCDLVPLCPWLDFEPDFSSGNLKIVVGTPLVPVAQVAALYRRLRPEMSALRSPSGGSRRSSTNPWPVRVPAFVNEHKDEFRTTRGHDWQGLLDAFSAEYADQPYTSAASFREMYYKFVRRERARGGGGTSRHP